MMQANTLSQAVIGHDTVLKQIGLVLGGSLFIAVSAHIRVPMFPVPMTLQTMAVLMVGFAYGSRLGVATVLAYLAKGAVGLPVLTGLFIGPTTGFLMGFILIAWLAGLAAERGLTRNPVIAALIAIPIAALIYVPGAAWPLAVAGLFGLEGGWVNLSLTGIWANFMAPFLIGDAIKAVIAGLIVSGAFAALRARSKK
ncbi:biotin transporter BioY [Pseudaestuariivita rosea]|uniref:biotin transporter BioY n=1 Tax=Pseudaestuariivita rosea TaxID=2763263 RepID=UPI001F031352|nr:biotin transporter BioY [Pseudaestuariivita rosea]